MKEALAKILMPFSQAIHDMVAAIPMGAVRAGVILVFVGFAVWVARLRPQTPSAEGEKGLDLRIFGIVILLLQIALYLIF